MPAGPRAPRPRRIRSGIALGLGTSMAAAMCGIGVADAGPAAPAAPHGPTARHAPATAAFVGSGRTPQERADLATQALGQEAQGKSLQDAYNVGPLLQSGNDGRGTTVATLVSFGDKNVKQYLDDYSKKHGLPPADVETDEPAGAVPPCEQSSSPQDCQSWGGETDLDVAMLHTLAPGAKIRVVATPTNETQGIAGFPEMMRAMDWVSSTNAANVLSLSLGTPEDDFDPKQLHELDPHFEKAAKSGVTVTASSGDEGATGKTADGKPWGKRVAGFPAVSPWVTAVGGTQLKLDAQGQRTAPDELWSRSGAGVSHEYGVPAWQREQAQATGAQGRSFPDVALQGVEGTSQSSPLFAAVVDLASQRAGKPLGLVNPELYQLGKQGTGFVDITKGDNSYDSVRGFKAGPGFDTASGWGTVDAGKLVPALARASK